MTVLVLLLIIIALVSVLVLREPDIRRRIVAVLRRREGVARSALGVSQPRDLQRQALSLVKEGALVSIGAVHLPSEIAVILNPSDMEKLGDLRPAVATELTDAVEALNRQPAGQGLLFVLQAKPNVILEKDEALSPGEVDVRLGFLEGTVAVTVNSPSSDTDDAHPVGEQQARWRLQVKIEGSADFFVPLRHGLLVGRSPSCSLCIAHESVSRQHAKFTVASNGDIAVVDLHSANGIRIGDSAEPIPPDEPRSLSTQSVIRLSNDVSLTLVDG